jgi:hypothetical protein
VGERGMNNCFTTQYAKERLRTNGIYPVLMEDDLYVRLLFKNKGRFGVPKLKDNLRDIKKYLFSERVLLKNKSVSKEKIFDADDVFFSSISEPINANIIAIVILDSSDNPLMVMQTQNLLHGKLKVNGGDVIVTWENGVRKIIDMHEDDYPFYGKESVEKKTYSERNFPYIFNGY